MAKLIGVLLNTLPHQNVKAVEAGASVIQCGPTWLYVGAISSPVIGGSLIELDPISGTPIRVQNNNHTIAVDLPFPINGTNDGITTTTAMNGSGLFMYVKYVANNPNIIYRGTWNETLLRFESFTVFATLNSSVMTGQYSTMAWNRNSNIYILSNTNHWARIDAFTANTVLTQPTTITGSGWSPSSYSFSNGYYTYEWPNEFGNIIGKSGNGSNWYAFQEYGNSATNVNVDTTSWSSNYAYGVNNLIGWVSPGQVHFSHFHRRAYSLSGGNVYTYPLEESVSVLGKNRTIKQIDISSTSPTPKVDVTNTSAVVLCGGLEINSSTDVILKTQLPAPVYFNILVTTKHTFAVRNGGQLMWANDANGVPIGNPTSIDWTAGNAVLQAIMNSTSPSAYTTIVYNGENYLVAIHPTNGNAYTWKILDNGALGTMTSHPITLTNFNVNGRAAWDGGSYVYFITASGSVFRWAIFTASYTAMSTINSFMLTWTSNVASGAIVKDGLLYIPSGSSSQRIKTLSVFNIADGTFKTSLRSSNVSTTIDNHSAVLQLSHQSPFLYTLSGSQISLIPITWRDTKNYNYLPPLPQNAQSYDAIPYNTRTVGEKTIGSILGRTVLTTSTSGNIKTVFFGATKVYLVESATIIHVYTKMPDGTIGTFLRTVNWGSSISYFSNTLTNNAPITMIVENGVDKVVGVDGRAISSSGPPLIYEFTINSDGYYNSVSTYGYPAGMNSYISGGIGPGRAAWDGVRYVYFLNSNGIWCWDMMNKSVNTYLGTLYFSEIWFEFNTLQLSAFTDSKYLYFSTDSALRAVSLTPVSSVYKEEPERIKFQKLIHYSDFGADYANLAITSNWATLNSIFVSPLHPNTGIIIPDGVGLTTRSVINVDMTLRKNLVPLDVEVHNNITKKENIDSVREKVNEFRIANGLTNRTWTDPNIVAGLSPIKAVHWNEITEAIDEVYSTQKIFYNTPSVASKIKETIIPKSSEYQITDLRSRLLAIIKALKNG